MRRLLPAALSVVALAAASGCGGSDEALGGERSAGSVTSMLGLVADTDANRTQVVYGSLARARAVAGIDEPTGDPRDYVAELGRAVGTGWVVAEPFRSGAFQEGFEDEIGFDLLAVDASIEAGEPPDQVRVFSGEIDAERVADALTTFEPWADDVEVGERIGVDTYRFGAELEQNIEERSPARPLGVGGRFGVDDTTVWMTGTDGSLDASIDAARDQANSLADDETFADAAGALDDAGAFTAVLTADAGAFTFDTMLPDRLPADQRDAIEERIGGEGLVRWDVAALGETRTNRDPGLVVVLAHGDEAAAATNADRLRTVLRDGQSFVSRRAWSDICSDAVVRQNGSLVIATCSPEQNGLALQIVAVRDSLLVWN